MARIQRALHGQFLEFAAQKRKEREKARAGEAALERERMALSERLARPLAEKQLAETARIRQETALGREYDPRFAKTVLGQQRAELREREAGYKDYLREIGTPPRARVTRPGIGTLEYERIGAGPPAVVTPEVARPAVAEPTTEERDLYEMARKALPSVLEREKKRRRYLEEFQPEVLAGLPAGATTPISTIGFRR